MPTWRTPKPSCTIMELAGLLVEPSGGYYVLPLDPYNEVYPGIYVGDRHTALCTHELRSMGITHVLNAAHGSYKEGGYRGYVNTNTSYYSRAEIMFKGVPAVDLFSFDLSRFFHEAADFIDEALNSGGKVLVHCQQGVSRSATLVLAFLMLKRGMTAQEATREVRAKREIIPNDGFLRQLCELNETLIMRKRQG